MGVMCRARSWFLWATPTRIYTTVYVSVYVYRYTDTYTIYRQHGAKLLCFFTFLPCMRAHPYQCIFWADSTPTRIYTTLLHYKIYSTLRILQPCVVLPRGVRAYVPRRRQAARQCCKAKGSTVMRGCRQTMGMGKFARQIGRRSAPGRRCVPNGLWGCLLYTSPSPRD